MSYADQVLHAMSYNWPYTFEELQGRCMGVPESELKRSIRMLVSGGLVEQMPADGEEEVSRFTKWKSAKFRSRQRELPLR